MTGEKKESIRSCPGMNRREFLYLMAMTSVMTMAPSGLARAVDKMLKSGPESGVSLAGISRGAGEKDIMSAIRQAAEAVTDFSWLSRGDSVLIKPVVNSGNPYPATTGPESLNAVISLLKDKGAGRIVVSDMSGIENVKLSPDKLKGSTRELMKSSGLARAVETAGAEIYLPEEEGWGAFYEEGPAGDTNWKNGIMMPKIIKEIDHIVLLPRCGRHLLAGSTLGLKAAVGYWRADTRLEYHRDAATLQEKTAEANTVSCLREKQRLVVTQADKVLANFGPDQGYVIEPETGLVIASESVVAHDMVSLAWLLETRRALPEDEKKGRRDPYTVQFIVSAANKIVTGFLGGVGQAINAEKLTRNDIETIWDDRVLKRAFQLFGGIPRLNFIDANALVPPDIKHWIAKMTTPAKSKKKVYDKRKQI